MLALRQYEDRSGTSWEPIHFGNAEERFQQLIRRYQKDPVSYVTLAMLYRVRARRQTEEAEKVEWFSRALEVLDDGEQKSYDPSAMVAEKGRVFDELGQLEDADAAFRSSLQTNPANNAARYVYGRFLLRKNRTTEALIVLQTGLDLDTDDQRLRHLKGLALEGVDAPQEAVLAKLRAAAGPNMRNWQAGFDMAVYLYIKGLEIEAGDAFSELRSLELDDREKRRIRPLPSFCDAADLNGTG